MFRFFKSGKKKRISKEKVTLHEEKSETLIVGHTDMAKSKGVEKKKNLKKKERKIKHADAFDGNKERIANENEELK